MDDLPVKVCVDNDVLHSAEIACHVDRIVGVGHSNVSYPAIGCGPEFEWMKAMYGRMAVAMDEGQDRSLIAIISHDHTWFSLVSGLGLSKPWESDTVIAHQVLLGVSFSLT